MNYLKSTLASGVRVLTIPMPAVQSATLTVWVKTGSRNEEARINGISHFLEHMVFKGSKKRPSAREISGAVDAIGGEFNAGTGKEWTNFYIKARKDNLPIVFDVLSDMVLNPLLKPEEIEKEKGVIIEEIAMYEDTPMFKIGDVFEELIFGKHPLSLDISGTAETVKAIKKDDFVRYRELRYYPDNIIITVAGGVEEKEVVKLAEKYFGKLSKQSKFKSKSESKNFQSEQAQPQVKLHAKKKEQAHLILGFRGNPRGHKDRFAEAILASILGGGMSSRLFIEVRERRGLAYSIRTSLEHYMDTGYIGTYAGVDVNRAEEAIKVILEEHYKITNHDSGITIQELNKAKEYIKGHLALALEDTKDVASFFGESELMLDKVETPEEVFKKIDEVKIEGVVRVAKEFFVPERLNLAIIGPYDDKSRFEKLIS